MARSKLLEKVTDSWTYSNWLDNFDVDLRKTLATVLALRASARVFPFLAEDSDFGSAEHAGRTYSLTIGHLFLRSFILFPNSNTELLCRNIQQRLDLSTKKSAPAYSSFMLALKSAVDPYSYSNSFDAISRTASATAYKSDLWATVASHVWHQFRIDAEAIENGLNPKELLKQQAWNSFPIAKSHLYSLLQSVENMLVGNEKLTHFLMTCLSPLESLEDRLPSNNRWALDKLELSIAMGSLDGVLNRSFWWRKADDIDSDVSHILDLLPTAPFPQKANELLEALDVAVETQNPIAPTFSSEGIGPVDHEIRQSNTAVANSQDNREGHQEVKRLTQTLLALYETEGASRNNDNQTAYDRANLLLVALGETLDDIKPALLIPRGEALRQLLQKQREIDPLADVPPCSDKVKDALKVWQAAYNPFVALDAELARRDEALVGPDAKRIQIAPAEAKAKARSAFDLGAITPGAQAAINENADIAPAVPADENRNSRRLTEGTKNLLRAVVVKIQIFVRWVKANPLVT